MIDTIIKVTLLILAIIVAATLVWTMWYLRKSSEDPILWAIKVLQKAEEGEYDPREVYLARKILDLYLWYWR